MSVVAPDFVSDKGLKLNSENKNKKDKKEFTYVVKQSFGSSNSRENCGYVQALTGIFMLGDRHNNFEGETFSGVVSTKFNEELEKQKDIEQKKEISILENKLKELISEEKKLIAQIAQTKADIDASKHMADSARTNRESQRNKNGGEKSLSDLQNLTTQINEELVQLSYQKQQYEDDIRICELKMDFHKQKQEEQKLKDELIKAIIDQD
eukprot:c15236_g1_i1.p1 GENE.c15236_g1_i1~~c15236_g1_i1.p1  ORF type:complete len:209 (+),score=69.42 c15236_g1_i1:56-682(+)